MAVPLVEWAAQCACCCDGQKPKPKQLLLNGGFEENQFEPYPAAVPPEIRYYQGLTAGDVPGWSVIDATNPHVGNLLIQNNGRLQDQNLSLDYCFNSPVGNQFVQLQPGGAIYQTFELEINKRYSFSFLQSGYFNVPGKGIANADVRVQLLGPDNSVVLGPYVIDPELVPNGTGAPPIWRWNKDEFHVTLPGTYTLTLTCGPETFDGNVSAAFIDAVCLRGLAAP
jgi:hypothetical protein